MSKSLKLFNGDLQIGNKSFDVVKGRDKLVQDLTLWVLERIGTDKATPGYGSTLDGGTINGGEVASYIGRVASPGVVDAIQSEVSRIVQQYQITQMNKIKEELLAYGGTTTIDRDEAIRSIQFVKAKGIADQVIVQVALVTASNNQIKLTIPVGG